MRDTRLIETKLKKHFSKYKQAIILLGPRQVGKTTVVKKVFPKAKYLLVDEGQIKKALETYSSSVYKQIIGNARQIIIDEIHQISDPGRAVKLFYDQFDNLQIIVTGSSSLHIKNKLSESMAGRCIYYYMYPLTFSEYLYQTEIIDEINNNIFEKIVNLDNTVIAKTYDQSSILNQLLVFGLYPSVINMPGDKRYLYNLANTAIFKDIIELDLIDNRAKALELLKVLAYQIGNLISYSELSDKLGIDAKTVQRYIEIFEQSFILFRLYPYSTLKRNEIGKSPKIYFNDLGIRNALIENFDEINIRSDSGAIFENFIISEVRKCLEYEDLNMDWKINYWRLKSGSEVDLVISCRSQIIGCEVKFNSGKLSVAFLNKYPSAKTRIITSANFY